MSAAVGFGQLRAADLVVERTYEGGSAGTAADDPLAALLPVGNQGGFRYAGSPAKGTVKLVVLYTSGRNVDWPDELDPATGTFTYYGDNREPGRELHDTRRRGNLILRSAFAAAAGTAEARRSVPPFLLFERAAPTGRSVTFRGLLAPGSPWIATEEQLVAIWRNRDGQRFQNYRATFTVLDASVVPRSWLSAVLSGDPEPAGPRPWERWIGAGAYEALVAPPTTQHRTRAQQIPVDIGDLALLDAIWRHFKHRPVDFERCAVELFKLAVRDVESVDLTRPSRDGGRDAVGRLAIGPRADPVRLEFALEAKCYKPGNAVGVAELARLISRIKHREFGALVTTSYVHEQAYREIRDDGHPIIVISGRDLVSTLKNAGLGDVARLQAWLEAEFAAAP